MKEETEREISRAVEKAVSLKLQKLQAKLDRCIKEKKFLDEVVNNPGLRNMWMTYYLWLSCYFKNIMGIGTSLLIVNIHLFCLCPA